MDWTPWTVAHQVPPSMGFSRQEYWSGFAIAFYRGSSRPRDQTRVSYVSFICRKVASLVAQEVKASARNAGDLGSISGLGRFPWRRKWQPTPVFLPGESHGRRNLVGYSPQGCKESDTTSLSLSLSLPLASPGHRPTTYLPFSNILE